MKSNERNLLRVLLLTECIVSAIDAVETDNAFWQQDVKSQSKKLRDTIIKKHGGHISALYDVQGGEYYMSIGKIVSDLTNNITEMDLIQWGAMTELSKMVLENPHVTFSEDDKDKVISKLNETIAGMSSKIEESAKMVDLLHTKLSNMKAVGSGPYQILSSELINIKRSLRKAKEV